MPVSRPKYMPMALLKSLCIEPVNTRQTRLCGALQNDITTILTIPACDFSFMERSVLSTGLFT